MKTIEYPTNGDIIVGGVSYSSVQEIRDSFRIIGIPTKEDVERVEAIVRGI